MKPINISIVGLGNCASSLIQGIHYYKDKNPSDMIGLLHWSIAGYTPSDIRVSAAFDIDARKVGKDVHDSIFSEPNCTTVFQPNLPKSGVTVLICTVLDAYSELISEHPYVLRFTVLDPP